MEKRSRPIGNAGLLATLVDLEEDDTDSSPEFFLDLDWFRFAKSREFVRTFVRTFSFSSRNIKASWSR